MNDTIIGSGNMGRGIETRFVSGGHSVTFMDRQPDKAKAVASDVAAKAKKGARVEGVALGSPIKDEFVVLAIPYGATGEVIENLGKQLDGKTIIDIVPYLGFMNVTFVVICLTVTGVTYGKIAPKVAAWMFLTLSFTCLFVPAIGLLGYGKLPF